jgi:glycine/D-amino acid oxidase-like deaminating enzyme
MLWSGDFDARVQALGVRGLSDPSPSLPPELAREAVQSGSRYLPALRGATAETARVCVRALPRDGLPVVGWLPQADGLYVIVAHAAVTLAPALGELAASEIVDLRDEAQLKRFRADRFSLIGRDMAIQPGRTARRVCSCMPAGTGSVSLASGTRCAARSPRPR